MTWQIVAIAEAMIMDDHHLAWLALTELNLSFKQGWLLAQQLGHGPTILEQQHTNLVKQILNAQQQQTLAKLTQKPLPQSLEKQLLWLQQQSAQLLLFDDLDYPDNLNCMHYAPAFLWLRGRTQLLNEPSIAMVGARAATAGSMAMAKQFAGHLANSGLTLVSGLALGIDGACHQGTLDVQGDTVAVLGAGLGKIYPARHQALAQRIVDGGGLLVSPWPLMAKPLAYRFPARNGIISGLSLGVLVVEAALRSGSLITAKAAMEQGREVFAIPSSVHNTQAQGCHQLIREGAILVDQPQQIITELALQLRPLVERYQTPDTQKTPHTAFDADLTEELQLLLRLFSYDPVTVDILCAQLAQPYNIVAAKLTELELLGLVRVTSAGYEKVY